MKKLTACGLAIAMLGTGLAGCGSAPKETQTSVAKEEQSETVQEKEEKPAEETAAEKEEPVKLLWLSGAQTQEANPDAEIIKRVNERFNVDLNGFYVGAKNYQENLNVRFAGGELPDVMVIDTPALLSTYVEGGIVGELPIEVIREKAPNFAKACDKYEINIQRKNIPRQNRAEGCFLLHRKYKALSQIEGKARRASVV